MIWWVWLVLGVWFGFVVFGLWFAFAASLVCGLGLLVWVANSVVHSWSLTCGLVCV